MQNGFRLVVKKAETKCPDGVPSVLTVRDFGVALTPDCKFVPRGCVKSNQKFTQANVRLLAPFFSSLLRVEAGCGSTA